MQKSFKETLNLPETSFPMKANAAVREPEFQTYWEEHQVYETLLARRKQAQAPKFVLHDGPPYLSADKIHIGTALNKILKDVVTRYRTQSGHYAPYVPGYDGHGLPIENAVVKSIKGGRKALTDLALRRQCREFALKNLKGQEQQFKRLGVWGNWAKPYVTVDGSFEAVQIELFAQMVEKGYIYKGLKPVHWCVVCETALAEAEVEYEPHVSQSLYATFPCLPEAAQPFTPARAVVQEHHLSGVEWVIWTTTPWTLPGNVAISANAEFQYRVVTVAPLPASEDEGDTAGVAERRVLVATDRLEAFLKETGLQRLSAPEQETVLGGRQLEGIRVQHPFIPERESVTLLGDHVTLEAGTGLVHTAPGHGLEDYQVVLAYNRQLEESADGGNGVLTAPLPVLSPVNGQAVYVAEVTPEWLAGVSTKAGAEAILQHLRDSHHLLSVKPYEHAYPHCWRCHHPLMFRATEQWFVSVAGFRKQALQAAEQVAWIPDQGKNRIYKMIEGRTDWCISRQRAWGVPIPAFYCEDCNAQILSRPVIDKVAAAFRHTNSDAWWEHGPDELLGELAVCPQCGSRHLRKETDIMDVWFDSGVSHTAVVHERREELGDVPVELYLEGSDQHRGWFQSSLLTSVMTRGGAPYKSVLTHGFVLDEQGRKMSKSLGNVVDPTQVTSSLGADVLRLWVASVDYTHDVRIGQTMLQQLADAYRKIRNTARFILGNLADFNPATDLVPHDQLGVLDRYVLARLAQVVDQLTKAFDRYEFHQFYQLLQPFCVIELSSVYFDYNKDVLYCHPVGHPERRSVQTVLYHLLRALTALNVPVMPHLAEDIFQHWPAACRAVEPDAPVSALMMPWPVAPAEWSHAGDLLCGFQLLSFRDHVNKLIESVRSKGLVAGSQEAVITVALRPDVDPAVRQLFAQYPTLLTSLCLVSDVQLAEGVTLPPDDVALEADGYALSVQKTPYEKCERCWRHMADVGTAVAYPTLCGRCANAVASPA
jgi:isoleucyl-tRNA synthetase